MSYLPVPKKDVIKIKNIYTVHYFEYARDFIFTGEKHDFWEMAYIDNGEVGVVADSSSYTLRQGEAVFHKPMEYHNIWANNRYANVVIITFSTDSTAMSFFKNKIITFDEGDKELLSVIIRESERTFAEPLNIVDLSRMTVKGDAPLGGEQLVRSYVEILLIGLAAKNSSVSASSRITPMGTAINEGRIVTAIKAFLAEDLTREVTLDVICGRLCFSKTYIKNIFKKHTGTGIIQYFITLKIEKAKRLISEGELSYSEIAENCGFSSLHYFSRTFKKHTGMAPGEYSKSIKSKKIL